MLFLLNDVIFNLNAATLTPPVAADRFRGLSLGFVRRLGAELFAEQPRLHVVQPERARRLAVLIAAKSPGVNAACFLAPEFGCDPDAVESRFAHVDFEAMVELYLWQTAGRLGPAEAERAVWGVHAA